MGVTRATPFQHIGWLFQLTDLFHSLPRGPVGPGRPAPRRGRSSSKPWTLPFVTHPATHTHTEPCPPPARLLLRSPSQSLVRTANTTTLALPENSATPRHAVAVSETPPACRHASGPGASLVRPVGPPVKPLGAGEVEVSTRCYGGGGRGV